MDVDWHRDRAFRYLKEEWDIHGEFQTRVDIARRFNKTREFIKYYPDKEIFSSIVVLELLFNLELDKYLKKKLIELLEKRISSEGFFYYFEDKALLPADVDDTAYGVAVLLQAEKIAPSLALQVTDKILANTSKEGVIEVYFDPLKKIKNVIDVVVCANALFLIYLFDKKDLAKKTEEYVYSMLLQPYKGIYYPSEDMFLYTVARLIAAFPHAHKKFSIPLREKIQKRIGITNTPLDLAMRVIAAKNSGIENEIEAKKLIALQTANGSWDEDVFYQTGKKISPEGTWQGDLKYYGGKEITTAFAIKALSMC